MGVLLQAFYKLLPNNALPSPADGKPGVPWWWDRLAAQASELSLSGFTAIWLPPVLKTASGATSGADGYGPFDDYDIGSKSQKGSVPTRYGSREDLLRCAAILRANGLDIYLDMVEHHRSGDGARAPDAFVFRYLGANGTPNLGRFPKDPSNFVPQVPRDPHLGGPPADDFPFARELAPINGKPTHYVSEQLTDAGDWLTRTVGAQGYRLDDVKGLSTDFLTPFLNSKAMAGKFAVGEFFDGNPQLVNQWIFNPQGMDGRSSAFDFPLKFLLTSMCNNPGRFNMADLDHAGLTGISPTHSVTFVENHDTDLQIAQRVIRNKLLGYAYILTSEGYPAVFYKDYSTDPGCYGLKPKIDNLIWIHEVLAEGATLPRWKDFDVFAYERDGNQRLLVALNNNPTVARTIEVTTGFGGNVHLKDYSGHGPDVFTNGAGSVTIAVPANINGLGYVCYSVIGQDRALVPATHLSMQDIEGALDLDVLPAIEGKTVTAGRIWCAAGSPIRGTFTINRGDWGVDTKVELALVTPDGLKKSLLVWSASADATTIDATAGKEGFHGLEIWANSLPATNNTPAYKLSLVYSAPKAFVAENPVASPGVTGEWGPVFDLANVAIHAHLLPTGKVLYWGRRSVVGDPSFASLNEHFCSTFLWDPATGKSEPTAQPPRLQSGDGVNLFCSGHSFLSDGRLLVVGGHLFDSEGVDQACTYNPFSDTWDALPRMNNGRWYPSAITLPDGGVLAISGSFAQGRQQPPPDHPVPPPPGTQFPTNPNPQIWRGEAWEATINFIGLQLYPRLHIEPKQGRVFMSGPQGQTFFLDTTGAGAWTPGPQRDGALRDYAPSVMYDAGKVLFIGGGQDPNTNLPTNLAETIDLSRPVPQWKTIAPMHFPRRQHNATVLPDGCVLVTGGTRGIVGNPQWLAFDNVRAGGPVHQAELWDPATGEWTILAEESVDRCYHSTALLLPDGRVLSAGGGEYAPNNPELPNQPNPPADSHKDAQLFAPPYLFKGPRPVISSAPTETNYGETFVISVGDEDKIMKVSWVRLGSVTHSCNQNQMLIFLKSNQNGSQLAIVAPANANQAPPGHYMLFVLNERGVPSVATIIRISAAPVEKQLIARGLVADKPITKPASADLIALDRTIAEQQVKPPVIVGITPSCPYGIGACWGGAFDALQRLDDIEIVRPLPDTSDSTAFVYLKQDMLPDLDVWREQFARVANGTYAMRGVEITISGMLSEHLGKLMLAATETRPVLVLAPLQATDRLQWDIQTRANKPMPDEEASAFSRLLGALATDASGIIAHVTGPLKKDGNDFFLEVREFKVEPT